MTDLLNSKTMIDIDPLIRMNTTNGEIPRMAKKRPTIRKCKTICLQTLPHATKTFFQRYKSFILQVVASGILSVTSDMLTQFLVEQKEWDYIRTGRFLFITIFFMAPLQYHWVNLLNNIKGTTWGAGFKRMLVDQAIGAPVFTSYFFVVMGLLEGHSLVGSISKAKKVLYPVLVNNYRIWPFVQLVNMSIVPVHFRLVFLQVIALFWSMYISFMNAQAGQLQARESGIGVEQ